MKRLIAAVILLFIVAGATTASFLMTECHYDNMMALLRECKALYESGDKKAAAKKAAAAENYWDDNEKLLAVFINRASIDEIGQATTRLSSYAKSGADTLFYAENALCIMLVTHMHDVEQVMVY